MTYRRPSEIAAEPDSLDSDVDNPEITKVNAILSRIRRFTRSGIFQVIVSSLAGAIVIMVEFAEGVKSTGLVLSTFGSYFGFLVGLGAILVLINSITVVSLVYYLQNVKADYNYYYGRYRDTISDLRNYLDSLHDRGVISREYDRPYGRLEGIMASKNMSLSWDDVAVSFLDSIYDELHKKFDKDNGYEWAYNSITTRLSVAEEAINGIGINLIQRVGMKLWWNPVVRSLWTIAATVLIALVAVIHFSGTIVIVLNGLAIGIGCMTLLLLIEAGENMAHEVREFFDDRADTEPEHNAGS